MRNLKKVLSLALALVMLIGMMVIGAGAVETDFADDGKIGDDYKEAVAVMNAIGVLQGKDADGNFDPQGTLTRAEAATILVRMTMGNDAAKGLANVTKSGVFTDMADHWAAGYVDACYNQGIVLGMDVGIYGPSSTLTGTQFAAMLLRAIGVEGEFTGPSWEASVIAAAAKAGLSEVTTKPIAREAASKMALDGLIYSPTGDKKDFTVTADEAATPLYSGDNETAAYLVYTQAKGAGSGYTNVKITTVTTSVNSLGQKTFGMIKSSTTTDLGRTATNYSAPTYKLDLTITSGADYTFVGKVTSGTMYSTVGKDVAAYTWSTKIDGVAPDTGAAAKPVKDSSAAFQGTAPGMNTEVYVHADKKTVDVLISNTYLGSVSKVVDAKGDAKAYVMVDGMKYETADYEKGDMVLYTKEDKTITSMQLAPELTGTLTKIVTKSGNLTYTIDGTDYVKANKGDTSKLTNTMLGKDVTFYTDTEDNIMGLKGAAATPNEYIYVAAHSANQPNPDYITSSTYPASIEVYGVNTSGEIVKLNVVKIGTDKIGEGNLSTVTAGNAKKGLYKITEDLDGAVVLSAQISDQPTSNIVVNKPGITYTGNKNAVANSQTAFVFISQADVAGGDNTITNVTVKTGIANIGTDIISSNAWLAIDGRTVEAVFVTAPYEDGTSDAAGVVYLKGDSEKTIEAWEDGAKKTWYTYTGVDQSGDEITVTSKSRVATYAGKVFEYDDDLFLGKNALVENTRVYSNKVVTAVKGSTIWLDTVAHSFNKTDDSGVVFISGDGTDVAAGQVVTLVNVAGAGTGEWDAYVVYVTKAGSTETEVIKPTKPTEGTDANKVIVTAKPGTSFVVSGTEQPNKITIGDIGTVTIPDNDWGNVDEVRGFTFQGTTSSEQNYTFTIRDSDGNVMYTETMSAKKGGVFYVQVVNLTDNQTGVSNSGTNGADNNGPLAGTGTELDKGTYSWSVVGADSSVAANGSFEITDNGVNPS